MKAIGCRNDSGACSGVQHRLQQPGGGRLGDGTEHQRADRDAELVDADHQRHVLHGAQRGAGEAGALLGAGLDLGTPGGDQRELRGDEERVAEQQEHREEDRRRGAHRALPRCRARRSARSGRSSRPSTRSDSRSIRSPSMCSTVSTRELLALGLVGVGAVGHRHLGDVAALGHPAEHLEHETGDGVVVLVVGQLDAGQVLDLVGAQQPRQRPRAVGAPSCRGRPAGRARRRCRRRSPRSRPRWSRCRPGRRTRRGRRRAGPPGAAGSRSGSSRSESGTTIGRVIRCLTLVVWRSGIGSATACLTCTVPTTVSSWSSTGNREWPVSRASSMTAQARSLASRLTVRTRGVMISPAVRVPNSTERSISSAVSGSRVPSSAEREISEASSVDDRAERSSSWGSIPSRRTIALAEPLSTRIGPPHHRGEGALEAAGWRGRSPSGGRSRGSSGRARRRPSSPAS